MVLKPWYCHIKSYTLRVKKKNQCEWVHKKRYFKNKSALPIDAETTGLASRPNFGGGVEEHIQAVLGWPWGAKDQIWGFLVHTSPLSSLPDPNIGFWRKRYSPSCALTLFNHWVYGRRLLKTCHLSKRQAKWQGGLWFQCCPWTLRATKTPNKIYPSSVSESKNSSFTIKKPKGNCISPYALNAIKLLIKIIHLQQ